MRHDHVHGHEHTPGLGLPHPCGAVVAVVDAVKASALPAEKEAGARSGGRPKSAKVAGAENGQGELEF